MASDCLFATSPRRLLLAEGCVERGRIRVCTKPRLDFSRVGVAPDFFSERYWLAFFINLARVLEKWALGTHGLKFESEYVALCNDGFNESVFRR